MQSIENKVADAAKSNYLEHLLLILSAVGTTCILGWLMKYSHYGIDFTDEGFYLVWMSNPFIYDWSITQFGFIYHPLYLLLKGNIAALRQANILITFFLSWILLMNLFKIIFKDNRISTISLLTSAVLSAGFATASLAVLVFAGLWLPTPSYNSLTFQALLIAATGFLLAESTPSRSSVLGWILIGIGGWLAFMAKPSSALALAVCAGVYLVLARKTNVYLLLISVGMAVVLLLTSAFTIDGSLVKFIERVQTGVEIAGYLGAGHTLGQIIRLDNFQLNNREKIALLVMTAASFISARFVCTERRSIKFAGLMLSALLFSVIGVVTAGAVHRGDDFDRFQGLLIWAVPFSSAALGFAFYRGKLFSRIPNSQCVLAASFIAMPYVYAFGSNNNYWVQSSLAGLFWVLAGLILVAPIVRARKNLLVILPLALAAQAIVAMMLQTGLEKPYRQAQPLHLNNHRVDVGKAGSTLTLSAGDANYLHDVVTRARDAGFKAGMPVIDLTGQSPGVLYALQAVNLGQPWMLGGYPGSLKSAAAALSLVSCEEIASAWLLTEPNNPISIPNELLANFGASVSAHYAQAAAWETAAGDGGYQGRRLQLLLKPTRSIAAGAEVCNAGEAAKKPKKTTTKWLPSSH